MLYDGVLLFSVMSGWFGKSTNILILHRSTHHLDLLGFSKLLAIGNDTHNNTFIWLFARSEEGKNIKNTRKKAWKIVSHNKL
jgi:hypothetical protein